MNEKLQENYIIKRDGRKVPFNEEKIIHAILAAFKEADGTVSDYAVQKAENIASYVSKEAKKKALSVEQIQDIVESGLMSCKRKDVAKLYILYRDKRSRERTKNSDMMKAVAEKIKASDVQGQNANVDERSFGGRVGESTRVVMKQFALDNCMSNMARENHLNNEIYIHDLDSYAVGEHNCMSIPFDKLLANGFNTRQTDVRPAQSINTAMQLIAVIFQLQSLQEFGGVSATHLDWTMVPYVRKSFIRHFKDGMNYILEQEPDFTYNDEDSIESAHYKKYPRAYKYAMDKTEKELKQAVEGMYHNLNTLQSRSGNQLPFTSINYGTCTLPEGRMVIRALLNGSINGVGKLHRTPIFPCSIFQCMKGVNRKKGDPNYDLFQLAIKSTALRLYPNYCNVDWSNNAGYDRNDPKTYFSTMGCRTANGSDINAESGVNPQTKDGRGNICPVTIIMPTLAMEADRDVEKFTSLLDKKIDEAREMLLERYHWICSQDPASAAFMYENGVIMGYDGKTIESAMKHGTLAVGQIGLAETLQLLIGKNQLTEEGMNLAKRIEGMFRDKCADFKKKDHLNFGVYYTPAENLCYTAMTKFKDKYGTIKNVSDKEFFTNSVHVPVWEKIDPFTKIDVESQLDKYSSAGCILYTELDSSAKHNLKAIEQIVNYAMDKDVPYFAINVPNDTCTNCGYTDEINDTCPMCGSSNIMRLRRVTGYLTGNYTTAFNKGKQQEVSMRYKHSNSLSTWKEDNK